MRKGAERVRVWDWDFRVDGTCGQFWDGRTLHVSASRTLHLNAFSIFMKLFSFVNDFVDLMNVFPEHGSDVYHD